VLPMPNSCSSRAGTVKLLENVCSSIDDLGFALKCVVLEKCKSQVSSNQCVSTAWTLAD